MELKPFDKMDWAAFAGAEGENPMILYTDGVTDKFVADWIVMDDAGIQIGFNYDGGDEAGYFLNVARPLAELIVAGMTVHDLTETRLKILGFERIA